MAKQAPSKVLAGRSSPSSLPRVAIVVSRYNASITDKLESGSLAAFEDCGGDHDDIVIVPAAGSWEIVPLTMAACDREDIDGVVTLGCIIKGETTHDRVLADAVAKGLIDVMMTTGKPVSLGVLTVENVAQAQARAGGDQGNKGAEAMLAMIETWRAMMQLAGKRVGVSHTINDMPDKAKGKIGTHIKKIEGKSAGSKR
jgi:6,7-dimethyl-8-ribityllumazine synthase